MAWCSGIAGTFAPADMTMPPAQVVDRGHADTSTQ
jgi:hypothetical protein